MKTEWEQVEGKTVATRGLCSYLKLNSQDYTRQRGKAEARNQ